MLLNLLPSETEINDCARFEPADALKAAGLIYDLSKIRERFGDAAAREWLAREAAEAAAAEQRRKSREATIFVRVQLQIRTAHRAAANMPCQRSRAPRRRVAPLAARRTARRPTCHGRHDPPEPGEPPPAGVVFRRSFSIGEAVR
jgi:hypothetical protein